MFEPQKKWERVDPTDDDHFGELYGSSEVMRHVFAMLGKVAVTDLSCILVGETAAMQDIRMLVGRIAPADVPVLIEGEAGTGRKLVARLLHELSDRKGPFITVDCTAAEPDRLADEIARQLGLPRIALAELLAAKPLAEQFSRRFLRETMVFPFQSADHRPCLAAADPRDTATVRAAELVFGGPIELVVASAEDIATALNRLAGDDEVPARTEAAQPQLREDDIESLRDLATGAPVVRAVNDLFEQAVELRASDIHVEAMRSGLSVRMRVDGLLKPVPAPSGVLPQAVISRIKIVAGLNIAERRLPQDGAARLRIGRLELDVRVAVQVEEDRVPVVVRRVPHVLEQYL